MIIGRMLRKDLLRKKLITIVVFAFIFLSALLVASGTNLIIELSNSLNALFTKANTPHFVQMHAGPLDQAEIDSWAAANELVRPADGRDDHHGWLQSLSGREPEP